MTNQLSRPAAQPAHAADRFAREIVGILAPSGAALAAADAQAVGPQPVNVHAIGCLKRCCTFLISRTSPLK